MSYPAQRVTINAADYSILRPGLELLANGLANAKLGLFPRRNAWHRVDEKAANVYKEQAFDQAMSDRIITVRARLWNMTGSRRVRLDVFDIAVLALACRLRNANLSPTDVRAANEDIGSLGRRLETCRERAKRAAIKRIGGEEYRLAAKRWGGFVSWCRFNLLSFRASTINRTWRKDLWRSQREQLSQVISKLLADRFYESPDEKQMKRIVTLMASSSRRGRLHVGLRELLLNPSQFTDQILRFMTKRASLARIPNAPRPAWQVITDRMDAFNAYRERRSRSVAGRENPPPSHDPGHSAELPLTNTGSAAKDITPPGLVVSDEALQAFLAAWLKKEVPRSLWVPIRDSVRYVVDHRLTDHYRMSFTAQTIDDLIEELRPRVAPMLAEEPVGEFADWLLGIILAVRSNPSAIYDAVSFAVGHAVRLEREEGHAR